LVALTGSLSNTVRDTFLPSSINNLPSGESELLFSGTHATVMAASGFAVGLIE
jgi:hypothetical protein